MVTSAEQGTVPAGPPWESYVSDPEAEPDPEQWRTLVCWPATRGA